MSGIKRRAGLRVSSGSSSCQAVRSRLCHMGTTACMLTPWEAGGRCAAFSSQGGKHPWGAQSAPPSKLVSQHQSCQKGGGPYELMISSRLTQAGKQMPEDRHVKALALQVPVSSKHVKAFTGHLFHMASFQAHLFEDRCQS